MPDVSPSLFDDPQAGARPRSLLIYCDGGSRGNPGPSAIGAVVLDATTEPPTLLHAISERIGVTTNNVAEYRALIAALEVAAAYRASQIAVRADSKLVVEQVAGRWKVKQEHLRPLLERVRSLLAAYEQVDLAHVRREHNRDADALVNAALDLDGEEPGE